jgi:hypothetical protein
MARGMGLEAHLCRQAENKANGPGAGPHLTTAAVFSLYRRRSYVQTGDPTGLVADVVILGGCQYKSVKPLLTRERDGSRDPCDRTCCVVTQTVTLDLTIS